MYPNIRGIENVQEKVLNTAKSGIITSFFTDEEAGIGKAFV